MLEKREALLHKKMAEEIRKAKEYTKMKNKRGESIDRGLSRAQSLRSRLSGQSLQAFFDTLLFFVFVGAGSCSAVPEEEEDVPKKKKRKQPLEALFHF